MVILRAYSVQTVAISKTHCSLQKHITRRPVVYRSTTCFCQPDLVNCWPCLTLYKTKCFRVYCLRWPKKKKKESIVFYHFCKSNNGECPFIPPKVAQKNKMKIKIKELSLSTITNTFIIGILKVRGPSK